MLEVFYETETKIITAWRSVGRQGTRQTRNNESRAMLDIEPPRNEGASVRDYILDGQTVKLRPDFVVPEPPRDLLAEIDELKARLDKIGR